jgi:hypothetical protein
MRRRLSICAYIDGAASSIDNKQSFPTLQESTTFFFRNKVKAHLDGVGCQATLNTEVQAGFTLSDKGEMTMTIFVIKNQSCLDSGRAHHALLSTFPAVRVSQNEVCMVFQAAP